MCERRSRADWVSLKVDCVEEELWRRLDRPHGRLSLAHVLEGVAEFAAAYTGHLVTETMLVAGMNDAPDHVRALAELLSRLGPERAYLSIPTRPPAEAWVRAPKEEALIGAYQTMSACVEQVEYLIGYEGDAFAFTGDSAADLLSITAVHPMRREALARPGGTRQGHTRIANDRSGAPGRVAPVCAICCPPYLQRTNRSPGANSLFTAPRSDAPPPAS